MNNKTKTILIILVVIGVLLFAAFAPTKKGYTKISYEEYDRFLDSLWKLSDKAISNFNNDNIKLNDTLNMRKEKTPIQINDVVTFKKYNIYDIPRPYKIVKINDSMCILEDLEGNKFKTKLSYLDKRDSLYAEENFGKSF